MAKKKKATSQGAQLLEARRVADRQTPTVHACTECSATFTTKTQKKYHHKLFHQTVMVLQYAHGDVPEHLKMLVADDAPNNSNWSLTLARNEETSKFACPNPTCGISYAFPQSMRRHVHSPCVDDDVSMSVPENTMPTLLGLMKQCISLPMQKETEMSLNDQQRRLWDSQIGWNAKLALIGSAKAVWFTHVPEETDCLYRLLDLAKTFTLLIQNGIPDVTFPLRKLIGKPT